MSVEKIAADQLQQLNAEAISPVVDGETPPALADDCTFFPLWYTLPKSTIQR